MNAGAIKLSHFSVKEYLISTRVEVYFSIDEKTSHSTISELSIAYLLQFDDEPLTWAMLDSKPLAWYAAEHWIDHAKSGGMDSSVLQLILRLFRSESAPFKNWIQIHDIEIPWYYILKMNLGKNDFGSPLYYSSLAGLEEASDCLLQIENVNGNGGRFGNPLQTASYEGHEVIVKRLLENEAEVNAKGGEYGNALQAASHEGHEVIGIEAGVNAEGGKYGNALQAASYKGNEAIVKLLLENGAEVNAEGGEYGNALQAASHEGNDATVKLLLENGAEVNAEGGKYGNALQAASYMGNEAIVKLLLENGADVNAEGGEFRNALQAASMS